jgi:hypothetical protein
VLQEAVAHTGKSAAWQALGNWTTVAQTVQSMAGVLIVLGALLAVLALLALTPGETIEAIVRPLLLLVLGAVGGGLLALALHAAGLGGYVKNRVYVGVPDEVIDGDTIRIGDVSIRLYGLDAPEFHG